MYSKGHIRNYNINENNYLKSVSNQIHVSAKLIFLINKSSNSILSNFNFLRILQYPQYENLPNTDSMAQSGMVLPIFNLKRYA
jgi:hypothetical protein